MHKQFVHKKDVAAHLCDHCGKPFTHRHSNIAVYNQNARQPYHALPPAFHARLNRAAEFHYNRAVSLPRRHMPYHALSLPRSIACLKRAAALITPSPSPVATCQPKREPTVSRPLAPTPQNLAQAARLCSTISSRRLSPPPPHAVSRPLPRAFQNQAKLRAHVTALHSLEAPYRCAACPARFSWHSCLSRHVKKVHRRPEVEQN
ncbi:unnamed protein product, partial [Iphiclides podalirius]